MDKRYFITASWCGKSERGIFCDRDGNSWSKEEPHTKEEMFNHLGMFDMILDPKSESFSEQEIKQYTNYLPLAEYNGAFGIVTKPNKKADALTPA